jgi:hypothetical protein
MTEIMAKQKIEIEFWRDSKDQSPESDSIYNIVNKVSEAQVFLDCSLDLRGKPPRVRGESLSWAVVKAGRPASTKKIPRRACHGD